MEEEYNPSLICPHCNYEYDDPDIEIQHNYNLSDNGEEHTFLCGYCDKKFTAKIRIDIEYLINPVGNEPTDKE